MENKMVTSNKEYNEKKKTVKRQLDLLQKNLAKHSQRQQKEVRNWGFVGDLGHIKNTIEELNEMFVM